jgi:hypothetical protein
MTSSRRSWTALYLRYWGLLMVQTWSNWKRFPDAQSGEHVEAPIGPGVYEVRHTMTGRVVAFGHSANVANALADLKLNDGNDPALPQAAIGAACG